MGDMSLRGTRFTIRRLMIVIAAAAQLFAVFALVRERRRRLAEIDAVDRAIVMSQLAQAEAGVMADNARREDRMEDARQHEHDRALLDQEEHDLRQTLSRLQR
jgi:hypothetical protein